MKDSIFFPKQQRLNQAESMRIPEAEEGVNKESDRLLVKEKDVEHGKADQNEMMKVLGTFPDIDELVFSDDETVEEMTDDFDSKLNDEEAFTETIAGSDKLKKSNRTSSNDSDSTKTHEQLRSKQTKKELESSRIPSQQFGSSETSLQSHSISDSASLVSLQNEVDELRTRLQLYERPMDLDAFVFRVAESRRVSIHLTDSLQFPSHVVYRIERISKSNGGSIVLYRRFSDFVSLAALLEREFPQCLLPNIPPKRKINNTKDSFVKFRLLQLDMYLLSLTEHPILKSSAVLKQFLYISTEQWQELVERQLVQGQRQKQHDSMMNSLMETVKSAKLPYGNTAKDYIMSKIETFNVSSWTSQQPASVPATPTLVSSERLSQHLKNLQEKYDELYLFSTQVEEPSAASPMRKLVKRSDLYLKATGAMKKYVKLNLMKTQQLHKLANLVIHVAMSFGSSDVGSGPKLFSLLHQFSEALKKHTNAQSLFVYNISQMNIASTIFDVKDAGFGASFERDHNEHAEQSTMFGFLYYNLFILQGLERFYEFHSQRAHELVGQDRKSVV